MQECRVQRCPSCRMPSLGPTPVPEAAPSLQHSHGCPSSLSLSATKTWQFFPRDEGVAQQESQLWASLVHAAGGGFHNWQKQLGNTIRNGDNFGYVGRQVVWAARQERPGLWDWNFSQPSFTNSAFFLTCTYLFSNHEDFLQKGISKSIIIQPLHWNLISRWLSLTSLKAKQAANTTISWELLKKLLCLTLTGKYYTLDMPCSCSCGSSLKKNFPSSSYVVQLGQ